MFLVSRVFVPCQKGAVLTKTATMTILQSTHWKQGLRSSEIRKRRKWRKWQVSLRQRHGLEKAGLALPWHINFSACISRGDSWPYADVHDPKGFGKTLSRKSLRWFSGPYNEGLQLQFWPCPSINLGSLWPFRGVIQKKSRNWFPGSPPPRGKKVRKELKTS